jgi:putative hydrolase of the HAD superfamily
MVIVFDLDDTLYDESSYVAGGFRAVAAMLQRAHGVDRAWAYRRMRELLAREGRGRVFDQLLTEALGRATEREIRRCVSSYRQHPPRLTLLPAAKTALDRHRAHPLYLVTDGNKNVQARKVHSLRLEARFRKIFITHRYGMQAAKPSLMCFERIRELEGCAWSDLAYVGDNPAKDFVALNAVGAVTVRVLTGAHADVVAKPGYDAKLTLRHLGELDLRASKR